VKPRLFYASQSIEDAKVTNLIQVRQMVSAFSQRCSVTLTVRAGAGNVVWPPDVEVIRLKTPRSRLGNAGYGVMAYREFRRRAGDIDYVYSRHPGFSALCGRLAPAAVHAFESHHYVPGRVAGAVQGMLYRRVDMLVAISSALDARIRQGRPWLEGRTLVAHDAHGNVVDDRPLPVRGPRLRVGYFGKLIASKGRDLLPQIMRACPDMDFFVYTPSTTVLAPAPNLVDYRHLPHEAVADRMREMDVMMLPVVPQDDPRDFTAYTSPLKLFEYLSVGGVIVGSDQPVLREVLTHGRDAWLVPNTVEGWRDGFRRLADDHSLAQRLSSAARGMARERTWQARADAILSAMEARRR
jgi:hypothetical protein